MRMYDVLLLGSVTTPAMPIGATASSGTAITGSDAGGTFIKNTANTTVVPLSASGQGALTATFLFKIANAAAPSASYFFPAFRFGNLHQLVISRGVAEARGAMWIQSPGLLAGSAVGTSGTTFAQNQAYAVTFTNSGTAAAGPVPTTLTVAVQRVSDGFWLNGSGAWVSGYVLAINITDSSNTSNFQMITLNWASASNDVMLYSMRWSLPPFTRVSNNPVIAKGATYDGWLTDALAAPAVCWDGTRFVLNVSFWSIANTKWAGGFFTSADLRTWTYVTGSLMTPTTGNYISSNAGITYFQGKYWLVYAMYPNAGTSTLYLQTSTDLINWTSQAMPAGTTNMADPWLNVHPVTGKLEMWLAYNSRFWLYDSPDGATWTSRGQQWLNTTGFGQTGEPAVYYIGDTRYVTHDIAIVSGRSVIMWQDPSQNAAFVRSSTMHNFSGNSWEGVQVFDACGILADLNDGRGPVVWLLYAGSNNTSGTDNTNSSVGLAYHMPAPPLWPPGSWNRRAGGRFGQF